MGLKINNKDLNIGDKIFAVNKVYIERNIGGTIIVCRIKSFENKTGDVKPILIEVGTKNKITYDQHVIYDDIDLAIQAITTKDESLCQQ